MRMFETYVRDQHPTRDDPRDGEPVVVGVDTSASALAALRWAAAEAHCRRVGLTVVHVSAGGEGDVHRLTRFLAATRAITRGLTANLPVSEVRVLSGQVVDQLVDLSAHAALVVLGVDLATPRSAHGPLGPVEDRVAVAAHCPVVVVPEHAPADPDHGPVVVEWTGSEPTDVAVLLAARRQAGRYRSGLEVLSCGSTETAAEALSSLYGWPPYRIVDQRDGGLTDPADEQARADLLVAAGRGARLIVLGGDHGDLRWSPRAGVVVTAVIHAAPCPVMIVGRAASPVVAQLSGGLAERASPVDAGGAPSGVVGCPGARPLAG